MLHDRDQGRSDVGSLNKKLDGGSVFNAESATDDYMPMSLDDLEMNAPCTALGCIELLDRTHIDLKGKHVVGTCC